jgi:hypothetical protein
LWHPGRSGARSFATLLLAVTLGLAMLGDAARAEPVHDLSRALVNGRLAKTRLSAAISLGRLRDPRSLRPLMRALVDDRDHRVRAEAASALGRLAQPAALPALRRARRDRHPAVRRQVFAAIAHIRDAQVVAAQARAVPPARPPSSPPPRAPAAVIAGGDVSAPAGASSDGRAEVHTAAQSDAVAGQQRIYVMLKSASDKSVGSAPPAMRQERATRMRALMAGHLARNGNVTVVPPGAISTAIASDPYGIDLTVVKLGRVERAAQIAVECEIRVAISAPDGRMLSVLTGGAKVEVPRATFREEFLPELNREALEGAVRSVERDLITHLIRQP